MEHGKDENTKPEFDPRESENTPQAERKTVKANKGNTKKEWKWNYQNHENGIMSMSNNIMNSSCFLRLVQRIPAASTNCREDRNGGEACHNKMRIPAFETVPKHTPENF